MAWPRRLPCTPDGPRMLELEELHDPRQWYSTNLVGVSSQLLSSIDFNDFPQRLTISSTRRTSRPKSSAIT